MLADVEDDKFWEMRGLVRSEATIIRRGGNAVRHDEQRVLTRFADRAGRSTEVCFRRGTSKIVQEFSRSFPVLIAVGGLQRIGDGKSLIMNSLNGGLPRVASSIWHGDCWIRDVSNPVGL